MNYWLRMFLLGVMPLGFAEEGGGDGGSDGSAGGDGGGDSGGDGGESSSSGSPDPSDGGTGESSGGDSDTSWRDSLPDNLKAHESLKKFETVETLASSYTNLEQMLGREKLPMPNSPEEFGDVMVRLGAHEDAQSYDLTKVDLPEGLELADGSEAEFKGLVHKLNLTNTQADGLHVHMMGKLVENHTASVDSHNTGVTQAEATLKQEWGDANYDRNMNIAQQMLDNLEGTDFGKLLEDTGLASHPTIIHGIFELGKDKVEMPFVNGNNQTEEHTVASLEKKKLELTHNPAYLEKTHPEHNFIVDEVYKINQMLYPGDYDE